MIAHTLNAFKPISQLGTVSISLILVFIHCQRGGSLRSIASRTDCFDNIQHDMTIPSKLLIKINETETVPAIGRIPQAGTAMPRQQC